MIRIKLTTGHAQLCGVRYGYDEIIFCLEPNQIKPSLRINTFLSEDHNSFITATEQTPNELQFF